MTQQRGVRGMMAVRVAIVATLAGPLLAFAAMMLVSNGVVSLETGLDLLTLKIALGLAVLAVLVALVAVVSAFRNSARAGWLGVGTLAVAVVIAAGFVWRAQAVAFQGPLDVSTDPMDAPAIADATGPSVACAGVAAPATQTAEGSAGWAMQQAGFRITDASLFQVRGERRGTFFGLKHEAVIRIRPNRTDVRVVARFDRPDGGETCRLATTLVDKLQVER